MTEATEASATENESKPRRTRATRTAAKVPASEPALAPKATHEPGWALREVKERMARARSGPVKLVPGQMALPDEVYQAMREWILDQALLGQRYYIASLLEVAAEQIPDDPADIIALVHEVPERFAAPNVNQQRSFRLAPDTAARLARVPMILRAAGYSKHAGRVHTALVLRFLADLGVTFED